MFVLYSIGNTRFHHRTEPCSTQLGLLSLFEIIPVSTLSIIHKFLPEHAEANHKTLIMLDALLTCQHNMYVNILQ